MPPPTAAAQTHPVLPRTNPHATDASSRVEWPQLSGSPRPTTLFRGHDRPPLRKLVALVDADLIDQTDALAPVVRRELAGLLNHPYVRSYRYADEGPPSSADWQSLGPGSDEQEVPGWALPPRREDDQTWSFIFTNEEQGYFTGIWGDAPDRSRLHYASTSYRDRSPEGAADQREADTLAALVAAQIDADIYITQRPYLLEPHPRSHGNLTICRPEEALALLGLYLRAQGEYVVPLGPAGEQFLRKNRSSYFWVGAREILPASWRWYSACVRHAHGTDDDTLLFLGASALQRVQHALEARDKVHRALNRQQSNATLDDALSNFEVALVFLLGAVDGTARVAHLALGFEERRMRDAGWQKSDWLTKVEPYSPSLAAVCKVGTDARHALTVLNVLRNTIHSAALHGTRVHRSSAKESLFGLPRGEQRKLLAAFNALGGEARWGVEKLHPNNLGFHADLGILLEELIPRIISLLNQVMTETPVERLSHVTLSPGDTSPPTEGSFAELIRHSIRLQLGL